MSDTDYPLRGSHQVTQTHPSKPNKPKKSIYIRIAQLSSSLPLPQKQYHKPEKAVDRNNPNENANPLTRPAGRVPVLLENGRSANLTVARKVRGIHAFTAGTAGVDPGGEFVDHHSLEDVGLFLMGISFCNFEVRARKGVYLIVNIMKDIFPEWVQYSRRDEKPADAHPEAVCKCDEGECDNEVREYGCDKDDERFGGD